MGASSLGWALVVVGSLLTVGGGILVWVGQQLVSNPERLVPLTVFQAEPPTPVLDARQHKLLQRIWEIQSEFSLDHLFLGAKGSVGAKELSPEQRTALKQIDLKVELIGGDPIPEDQPRSPELQSLIDSIPEAYLRRLSGYFGMRFGEFTPVQLTDAGIRYLRDS